MSKFIESVASKAYDLGGRDCQCENCTIARTIHVTIEALAREAEDIEQEWHDAEEAFTDDRRGERLRAVESSGLYFHASDDWYSLPIGKQVADWLRSHLESSGQTSGQDGTDGSVPEGEGQGSSCL